MTGRKVARSVISGEIDGAPPGLVATKSCPTTSASSFRQAPTDGEDGQREARIQWPEREAEEQSVRGSCQVAQSGKDGIQDVQSVGDSQKLPCLVRLAGAANDMPTGIGDAP